MMVRYLIGILGQQGPGIATALGDDGLRETIPCLAPGEYWIAVESILWGTAWVFSHKEWQIFGKDWMAGPGWVII